MGFRGEDRELATIHVGGSKPDSDSGSLYSKIPSGTDSYPKIKGSLTKPKIGAMIAAAADCFLHRIVKANGNIPGQIIVAKKYPIQFRSMPP